MIETTTDPRIAKAIANAHLERGKVWGEIWAFFTGH